MVSDFIVQVQENYVQILTIVGTMGAVLKAFSKQILKYTDLIKSKADSQDLEALAKRIENMDFTLEEIKELEELKARLSDHISTLPEEFKKEYKEILEKYNVEKE